MLEPIDPTRLAAVTGGMQFDPGLHATLSSVEQRRRANKPADPMPQAVRMIGTATADFVSGVHKARQQGREAMLQMLPQLMQR